MKPRTPGENANTSDAELVHAARRGDKRAFVEIVARHQAMVCGIALGILGDFAASEDAAQEAFLTAWRKFHELREPERLRAWLAQISRNAALGHLRRTRGYDPLENASVVPDESPLPDEAAASGEESALVRESLAKLPEIYRLPLILFYREGQSVRAVAEALSISEDAVKQRLARGREMLRSRMSVLVETVLTRTAPAAVFTMTIAVAIGALAAPAAIAATAFAASATAASASATAASTTPLLTAMSASKTVLVATAMVAVVCIPVGYQLSSTKPHTDDILAVQAEEGQRSTAASATPTFENSALFAEWRALHEKHGTNAQAMPALYKAIADIKDPFRRRAFRSALIAEWVLVDPHSGLAFFNGKGPNEDQRRHFLEEWLARDARAAVDALLASPPGWEKMARSCLPEIARRVPSRLPEIASRLPKADSFWDNNVRDAFTILAEGSLPAARKAAETVSGPSRDQALGGIAKVWARSDLNAAIAWARELPEGTDIDEVIRTALIGRAKVDPVGALDQVGLVPAGGRHAHFATTTGARVLSEAAKADFDATVSYLVSHPGRFGHDDLAGLVDTVTARLNEDAAGFLSRYNGDGSLSALMPVIGNALLNRASGERSTIWEWVKTQPETEVTRGLRREVLGTAAWQDPELAMRLMTDLPRTTEGDAEVKELARRLINGGHKLHRFDQLFPQAPERLRQPLLETAFDHLGPENLDDPQQWLARLSLLPEASRPKGLESIAGAWAQQNPEEAIQWANSLSSTDNRGGAVAGIASVWARKDPHAAGSWIASLPPGTERDRGASSFVFAVAPTYPREAWDWALSITDEAERSRAAAHAAKIMAARDPATARQWIASGPFSADLRTKLQSGLP